jgi:hypothetical protein
MELPVTIPVLLLNVADDVCELVDLVLDFPEERLTEIEFQWQPERKRLPPTAEHRHWKWDSKVGTNQYRLVAVMNDDSCEGLLAVRKVLRRGRNRNQWIMYVAYIESAPWNHAQHPENDGFRGVGSNLMMGAILLSQQTEANGAIGLHSLDSSQVIYRGWGMKNYGRDPNYEDLTYFQFTSQAAARFLADRSG